MSKLRICFDIDGVIADGSKEEVYSEAAGWNFSKCHPIVPTVGLIKKLKEYGCEIFLNTARFEDDREVTEKWLAEHGVPYDKLLMEKPHADLYIDDKNYPRAFCPDETGHFGAILEEALSHAGRRFD